MEEYRTSPLPSYAAPWDVLNPNSIRAEFWAAIDDPIQKVLDCIHPTMDAEEKRKDVTDYMHKLIQCAIGVQIFPYGSVPLKTYLPEADIDLAAIAPPSWDAALPHQVLRVLQAEAQRENTEFKIKEVQFIDAEVKLVKCIVEDIVIDVSFNQLGGLCSLCFLEQVDRVVDKDHLFKRSIILIKTWCYYEGRILGAYYGFLSTYALEILVLNIFQNFHECLTSPLQVLYMFLNYYSQFDWDNYCVSMGGPVIKSLLPQVVVENSDPVMRGTLLGGNFLKKCLDVFKVPAKASETNARVFTPKYLNIIDPLKENNNLGRSVNHGNSYNIRNAFRFGAHKLGEILELPLENVGDGIKNFFFNTLQLHQSKYITDIPMTFGTFLLSSDDLDNYVSGMDDELHVGSPDANNLSTLDLKTGNDLENGDKSTMKRHDNISKSSFYDIRKQDATGDDNENEVLNPLADLTGDYDSYLRSLLYSHSCHGFVCCAAKLCDDDHIVRGDVYLQFEVPVHSPYVPFQPSSSCPQGNPSSPVMQHPPYLTGHNNTRAGPYFPNTSSSTRGWERNSEPALPTRQLQQACGGSEAFYAGPQPCEQSPPQVLSRQVKSERKLVFGSFGPLPGPTSNPVASQPDVVCSRRTGRVHVDAFHLKNEEEFPPLST